MSWNDLNGRISRIDYQSTWRQVQKLTPFSKVGSSEAYRFTNRKNA